MYNFDDDTVSLIKSSSFISTFSLMVRNKCSLLSENLARFVISVAVPMTSLKNQWNVRGNATPSNNGRLAVIVQLFCYLLSNGIPKKDSQGFNSSLTERIHKVS